MSKQIETIQDIILFIKDELLFIYTKDEAKNISYLLVSKTFNLSRPQLHLKLNKKIETTDIEVIKEMVQQLKMYKPIQYVLGETTFYDLKIRTAKGVLIPRPETEELIDWIIKENTKNSLRILDIGTGSGCIAIALAKYLKIASVDAIDISTEALDIARKNAILNQVKINFILNDILLKPKMVDHKYDIIVSNPPYVLNSEKKLMHKNVLNYEPLNALFVDDDDPLVFYEAITKNALLNLKVGGKLYFEINENFGEMIQELLISHNFKDIKLQKDIHGKDRMIRSVK